MCKVNLTVLPNFIKFVLGLGVVSISGCNQSQTTQTTQSLKPDAPEAELTVFENRTDFHQYKDKKKS